MAVVSIIGIKNHRGALDSSHSSGVKVKGKMKSFDVLVKWDFDGSINIVSSKELRLTNGSKHFKSGSDVEMWWNPDLKFYTGTIVKCERRKRNKQSSPSSSSSEEEDNIPLSELKRRKTVPDSPIAVPDRILLICCQQGCTEEIFAACPLCSSVLCFDHFDDLSSCDRHIELPDFAGISFNDSSMLNLIAAELETELFPEESPTKQLTYDNEWPPLPSRSVSNLSEQTQSPVPKQCDVTVRKEPLPSAPLNVNAHVPVQPSTIVPESLGTPGCHGSTPQQQTSATILHDSVTSSQKQPLPSAPFNVNAHVPVQPSTIVPESLGTPGCHGSTPQQQTSATILHDSVTSSQKQPLPSAPFNVDAHVSVQPSSIVLDFLGTAEPVINIAVEPEINIHTTAELEDNDTATKRKGPSEWTGNKRKHLRETGQEYVCHGTERPARQMKERCSCKSKDTQCHQFTEEDRDGIFRYIWSLSWAEKECFVKGLVDQTSTRRPSSEASRRSATRVYFLKKDGLKLKVCKSMFLATTALTNHFVGSVMKDLDKSLAHVSTTALPSSGHKYYERAKEEKRFMIEEFLDPLPKMPSHYCRQSTGKLYLEPIIRGMPELYNLYVEKCEEQNRKPLCKKLLAEQFKLKNLSFFQPKKDQCDLCVSNEVGNIPEEEWRSHRDQIDRARMEKDTDKLKALASITENDSNEDRVRVLAMDLQCVLLAPSLKASALYYKTKLAIHNFTIFYLASRDVMCYVWHEGEGGLSANEFSSCIVHYVSSRQGFNKFIIYSDGCTYQNRNSVLASALSDLAKTRNITIEQKFLVKGHTQMEVDSVHSVIERSLKNTVIYVPHDYINVFKKARNSPKPYEVMWCDHSFFKDYTKVGRYKSIRPGRGKGDAVVTDIRALKYSPDGVIHLKLNFDQEWQELPKARGHTTDIAMPPPLYSNRLTIQASKFKHLQELKKVIPHDCHPFYDNLRH